MRVMLHGAIAFLSAMLLSALLPWYLIIAGIFLSVIGTMIFSVLKSPQAKKGAVYCFFLAAAFSIYIINDISIIKPLKEYDGKEVSLAGTVTENIEKTSEGYTYTLKIDTINGKDHRGKIRLFSQSGEDLKRGDILKVSAVLEIPENTVFYNDKLYSFGKGIYLSGETLEKASLIGRDKILGPIYSLSDKISASVSAKLPEREGDLLSGVLLNDKEKLKAEDKELLTAAGYSHLINVSGLHMSITASLVFSLFLIILKGKRHLCSVLTIFGIVFYIILTGFSVSAIRAGIMLILYYLGYLGSRQPDSLNSLGFAVLAVLAFNPFAAYDISLLLSAFSTFGIIYSGEILSRLEGEEKIGKRLAAVLTIILPSFSALIFSAPIIMLSFGRINLISPISNLALYIFITPFVSIGLLFSAAELIGISFIGDFLSFLLRLIGKIIFSLAEIFSAFSFAEIKAVNIGTRIAVILAIVLLMLILSDIRRRKKKKLCLILSLFIVLSASLSAIESGFNSKDSFYIINSGENVAYICGSNGNYSVFGADSLSSARAAAQFLSAKGENKIKNIYVSENNTYKKNAAAFLAEEIKAENILAANEETAFAIRETYNLAAKTSLEGIRIIDEDYIIVLCGGLEIQLQLSEKGEYNAKIEAENDSGVFVLAKYNEKVYYRYNGLELSNGENKIYRAVEKGGKLFIKEVKRLGLNFG
ncbi:MAG: ComEC/Rec2 family competence protein [Oscillospiraceae bacterium]|nr:ComEC/Rec2 family competence protein [Oscillospiraceae bacterium]